MFAGERGAASFDLNTGGCSSGDGGEVASDGGGGVSVSYTGHIELWCWAGGLASSINEIGPPHRLDF